MRTFPHTRHLVAAAVVLTASLTTSAVAEAGLGVSDPVIIEADTKSAGYPVLEFNAERNEYLAGYTDNRELNALKVVRLDAQGNPLTSPQRIGDREVDPFKGAAIAYQPMTNQYAVVWRDFAGAGSPSTVILGQLVSDLGVPVGPIVEINQPYSVTQCLNQAPEVEADLVTGGFKVTYVRFHPGMTDCDNSPTVRINDEETYFVSLASDLAVTQRVRVPAENETSNFGPELASNATGDQFLVGEFDRETKRMVSHIYRSDGSLVKSVPFDIPAQGSPLADSYQRTAAAADPVSGNWTIVATSFPQDVNYTQTISPTGAIVIPPTPVAAEFELEAIVGIGSEDFVLSTTNGRVLEFNARRGVGSEVTLVLASNNRIALAVDPTRSPVRVMTAMKRFNGMAFGEDIVAQYLDVVSSGTVPLTPARLLDTRAIGETIDGVAQKLGTAKAGSVTTFKVTGRAGIPSDAKAVVLNVTTVRPGARGFLTVFPCGGDVPGASTLNYETGAKVANSVVARVGDGGTVCVFTSADTEILADVSGFVPGSGQIASLVPARLLDTRNTAGAATTDGLFLGGGRVGAGSVTRLDVVGRGGVESSAQAVLVNVTSVNGLGNGFLTVYSCDDQQPGASNLNAPAGGNVANLVFTKVSASGEICIFSSVSTNLLVDVSAYAPSGAGLDSVTPARLFDGRPAGATVDNRLARGGRVAAGSVTTIPVAGRGGVPSGAAGAVLNVTAVGPSTGGFFTLYPCDEDRPNASNLNFVAGQIVANFASIKLSSAGEVCVYSTASTHLVLDVTGYGA